MNTQLAIIDNVTFVYISFPIVATTYKLFAVISLNIFIFCDSNISPKIGSYIHTVSDVGDSQHRHNLVLFL